MRHLGVKAPCVIVTGFGTTACAVEAMRLGAVDFLEKPVVAEMLNAAVTRCLPEMVAPPQTDRVEEFLTHTPPADWSVTALAKHLRVCPSHLRRVFASQFGASPHRYLKRRRLDLAVRLLTTSMSAKEVAHRLGFDDLSHFGRDFVKTFGYTPGSDRREVG